MFLYDRHCLAIEFLNDDNVANSFQPREDDAECLAIEVLELIDMQGKGRKY